MRQAVVSIFIKNGEKTPILTLQPDTYKLLASHIAPDRAGGMRQRSRIATAHESDLHHSTRHGDGDRLGFRRPTSASLFGA